MFGRKGGKRASEEEDSEVIAIYRRFQNPFPAELEISDRLIKLPAYAERQRQLAGELMEEIGIPGRDPSDPEVLRDAWKHFCRKRELVQARTKRTIGSLEPRISATHRYSNGTVLLLEKLSGLFAEALLRRNPNVVWAVPNEPGYVFHGWPVLRGFSRSTTEFPPAKVFVTIANRHMDDDSETVLLDLVDKWSSPEELDTEPEEDDDSILPTPPSHGRRAKS